jgi:general L-amino acid transport system permease protein
MKGLLMATKSFTASEHQPTPFYRNVKTLAILVQIAFVILIGLLLWTLYSNMITGLRRSNIPLGFDFLGITAGFAIPEGIPFQPTDTYARAFLVGIVNTLRVSVLGIILATILGTLIGIGRLSSNWLLRKIASTYVEVIRNVPLLVQIFFWYTAFILQLPRVRDAVGIERLFLLSNRGLATVWPRASASFGAWLPWLWIALLVAVVTFIARRWQLARADRPGAALPWALLAAVVTAAVGALVTWFTTGTSPLLLDRPELAAFNIRGGIALSGEFFALLLALTTYTAAFIAEIVRGGIQAISKGQREAAQALGLNYTLMLRLVILPQALRIIIPPMTNQYLNLTKNSSLGIAIAYYELFTVAATTANQTGRVVQVILLLMAGYLSLSLLTSMFMNFYNARIRLVER